MSGAESTELARAHAILRFACGTTIAFVLAEFMGWYPTFLPAILAATLLASLPTGLPLKAGLFLILVQTAAAFAALALSSLLRETPTVLFGAVGLIIFMCFANLTRGRAFLPIVLVLISFSTIPIVTLTTPQQAEALPKAFVRAMSVAVLIVWFVHAIWPKTVVPAPAGPAGRQIRRVNLALAGTAIVLPLMLAYLLYGLTDALPVLITTVMLVVNFDPSRGAAQGFAMIFGNLVGGMFAIACHLVLAIAPSLFMLSCTTFLIGIIFARRIARGGSEGTVGLITFNQSIIILSLGLMPGPSAPGIWGTRLLQFVIAYAFAVGLMYLLLPHSPDGARPQSSTGEEAAT